MASADRAGAAWMVLAARVPLVPAGLCGTGGWPWRLRWRISFGRLIELDDLHGGAPDDAARDATRRLWEAHHPRGTLVP